MKIGTTTEPKVAARPEARPEVLRIRALMIEAVEVDADCTGSRWTASDIDYLARIVAIVAMGQAAHAARIIADLEPAEPAINREALKVDAKHKLSIVGTSKSQSAASRYHRDGLIFEMISWAAANQETGGHALLRDPHLSSTMQGLDGLMIELDGARTEVTRATIFEDKCSEHPRDKFRDEIMPAFKDHHENRRATDLVATAAALIEKIGLDGTACTTAAARVLDKQYRTYRGSLAVTTGDDSTERRKSLFRGYADLEGIEASQRVGATLVTSDNMRAWFDDLATRAIGYIDMLGTAGA